MIKQFKGISWPGGALLFLPWAVACLLTAVPALSWWVAWLGSLAIFAWVWAGKAGGVDERIPLRLRILHPVYLMQAIFAGYGFVTAIFFWLEMNGIRPSGAGAIFVSGGIGTAAAVQRWYVLAHASLAFGLVLASRPKATNPLRFVWRGPQASLLLTISALASVSGLVIAFVPGLEQFKLMFSQLGLVAGAASLGASLSAGGRSWLPICLGLNGFLLLLAAASGWKEAVLVLFILIGLGTVRYYPKTTACLGGLALFSALIVLPVLSTKIRETSWDGELSSSEALQVGLTSVLNSSADELIHSTWTFATGRLSEAGMFMKFIQSVDEGVPREGLSILQQSLLAPVPRILWKGKPDLEKQVMSRVYVHGVISELSSVSAKPHPVVDAWLMGGGWGILFSFVVIGVVASVAFDYCQRYFGGVFVGGVFFNGMFSILWRGNSFEFMLSTLFWAVMVCLAMGAGFQQLGLTQVVNRRGRGLTANSRSKPPSSQLHNVKLKQVVDLYDSANDDA